MQQVIPVTMTRISSNTAGGNLAPLRLKIDGRKLNEHLEQYYELRQQQLDADFQMFRQEDTREVVAKGMGLFILLPHNHCKINSFISMILYLFAIYLNAIIPEHCPARKMGSPRRSGEGMWQVGTVAGTPVNLS
uniref:Uncharacterized protein n=1 Tax=Coccidioides posadasii RMSCC 3488 TaxID=454284 RepID=A0A0J6IE05_COCPO|nr:hypothetical protein CPAG_06304 [Coccidioides posadasii RMSCC 3488]